MKRFVCIWLPHLPIERLRRRARCDQRRDLVLTVDPRVSRPRTEGTGDSSGRPPFALTEATPRGLLVVAIDASARKAGLQVGLGLADARAICPGLTTRPIDRAADHRALCEIAFWLGRYGPNRNVDGRDGLWVEITGVAHLFGGEAELVADVRARFMRAGLTARLGLADTYGAAHALARYGDPRGGEGAIAAGGDAETVRALACLPVEALRLGPDSVLLLKRLGLRRIGALLDIPRAALARRFRDEIGMMRHGASRPLRRDAREAAVNAVLWRLDQALGREAEPRTPLEPPPVRVAGQSFSEPLVSSEGIVAAARDLCGILARTLKTTGEGALAVRLLVYRSDGSRAVVETGFSRPCQEAAHMLRLIEERLATVDAGLGVDGLAIEAMRVAPVAATQSSLASHTAGAGDDGALAGLVDRIANRIGADRVVRLDTVESHLPERAVAIRSALAAASPATQASKRPFAATGGLQRPVLLLDPPEPIEVLAELPEGPPARFRWRRVRCRVSKAEGPERIAPEWWRHLPAAGVAGFGDPNAAGRSCSDNASQSAEAAREGPRVRDYYTVEDDTGGRYFVFREGLYGEADAAAPPRWFLQGIHA